MEKRDVRRKFGQNYLSDPAIIFEMGQAIAPYSGNKFLEVGPGLGALTKTLNHSGIKIKAIDVDKSNIDFLSKNLQGPAEFDLVHDDILKISFDFLETGNFRIAGNLPYNISTQIILKFIQWSKYIQDMHFLVQKEVAEKITGNIKTKNWGKLSIKISAFFNTEILFDVPPESFDIKPKVMSSFIRMTPKKNVELEPKLITNLYKVIDLSFSSRRKNIRNNLKKQNFNWEKLDIDNNLRPEELSLEDYLKLAECFKE
jgi:16S rRNA (adenine1518-N6/adenine1519-N6)-dimethyltransferase